MGYVVERDPYALVMDGCRWIRKNPERWGRLLDLCEWFHAKAPNVRLRRGDLYVYAGQRGMSITDCMEYKFNNNLWSVLSRYVLMSKPWLADNIKTRKCGIDDVDLRNAWETLVGDSSCLIAEWRPAA